MDGTDLIILRHQDWTDPCVTYCTAICDKPNTPNNCKLDRSMQQHTTGKRWMCPLSAAKWEVRLHSDGKVW